MTSPWPSLGYSAWAPCCDTVHTLTQLLGKLAVATAPPEPQLQHAALRLTARGWETAPLPAANGSGAFGVALDMRRHRLIVEHTSHEPTEIAIVRRPVADITAEVLDTVSAIAGPVELNLVPQEVAWTVPLDADVDHRHYEADPVARYFAAATQAALVLARYRAPFRGRATPVNAWWGSFDLAVSLFSGQPAAPPATDFIMRNAMDSEEVAVGWWPGDARFDGAAFYAYAYPPREGFVHGRLAPAEARWEPELGEFVLAWEEIRHHDDPAESAVQFARSAFLHACSVCDWPNDLAATLAGTPPPVS